DRQHTPRQRCNQNALFAEQGEVPAEMAAEERSPGAISAVSERLDSAPEVIEEIVAIREEVVMPEGAPPPVARGASRREEAAVIALLAALDDAQWETPTALAGWSVKDIAAHIVGDDFGMISRQRDRYLASHFDGGCDELVEFINRQNDVWVRAMRRCSPRLL